MKRNFIRAFQRRHVWKIGAIVVYQHEGSWYYLVFKSLTNRKRGTQIVRGHLEPGEGLEEGVLREVKEELQKEVEIVAPFGLNYFESRDYSDCQIYYICMLKDKVHPKDVWRLIDDDMEGGEEELEWSSVPLKANPFFLSVGQGYVIRAFQRWVKYNEDMLKKHLS